MSHRSPTKPHRVSYVEEANDETGSVIEGTERYAVSEAPSPSKERSNTSKSRKHRPSLRPESGSGSSSPHNGLTDSDSTVHAVGPSKREKEARFKAKEKERAKEDKRARERERDRRKEHERELERAARKASVRPPNKTYKTTPAPILHSHSQSQDTYRRPTGGNDDSSFYGVSPASHRPRAMTASRPSSYYGAGSRPPASNTQWWSQHPGGVVAPPSYATPTYGSSPGVYPPPSPAPQQDYFGGSAMGGPQHQHLAQRFQRPSSATGHRPSMSTGQPFDPNPTYPYEEYEQENDISLARRPSLKKHHAEEDRRRMPPPPRPVTTGPRRVAIRGPPPPPAPPVQSRRAIGAIDYSFDDRDFVGEDLMYRDIPPRSVSYGYGEGGASLSRSQRRESAALEGGIPYRIEPAASSGRRHSYYGSSAGSLDYEDKFRAAAAYQEGITDGHPMPLTAETLRKAGKRSSDKSSHSTRSSGSRDESDNRQSNTTRTTRSSTGQGDDDFTIKVTGSATLKVGGAEIHCEDGGEINITQQGGNASRGGGGGGSDRASTIYSEDQRRNRLERLPIRARSSSQAPTSIYGRSPSYEQYGRPPFF
ncbi:hypothetical protein ACHAQA_005917 [Verticillium albo-atrum]